MSISVVIVPIGELNYDDLKHLKEELEGKFGACAIASMVQMPREAYNPQRRQYMSGVLLQWLSEVYPNAPSEAKILAVTREDLYSTGLNFVFGQAQLKGRYAIISVKRLDPGFYGMTPDRTLFLNRMVKEAVHELGHTLGFEHCPNRRCVMHFSNSLRDTDIKGDWFCRRCLAKVRLQEGG